MDSGEAPDDERGDEWADDERARKARNAKATRWRKLPNPTADQIKWLDEYDARKGKPGRPKKEPEPPPAAVDVPTPKVETPTIPRTMLAKVKTPPPILHSDKQWREKYSGGIENGRELLCTMLGYKWHKMLVAMEETIKDAGIAPIVDVSDVETKNLLVLAVDDILPAYLKATPAIVAAFNTTVLTTQRVMQRKAIAEAQERKKRPVNVISMVTNPSPPVVPATPKVEPVKEKEDAYGAQINSSGTFIR